MHAHIVRSQNVKFQLCLILATLAAYFWYDEFENDVTSLSDARKINFLLSNSYFQTGGASKVANALLHILKWSLI